MATGPHSTNYQIPQITLGDTFNEWRTLSNDSIINKLNRMKVYTGKSGDGISVGMKTDGEMVVEHSGEVSRGVTFSGPVSFNSEYTIINAKKLTIDDYIISIGGTGASLGTAGASGGGSGAADSYITTQGGGGLDAYIMHEFGAYTKAWTRQARQDIGLVKSKGKDRRRVLPSQRKIKWSGTTQKHNNSGLQGLYNLNNDMNKGRL